MISKSLKIPLLKIIRQVPADTTFRRRAGNPPQADPVLRGEGVPDPQEPSKIPGSSDSERKFS